MSLPTQNSWTMARVARSRSSGSSGSGPLGVREDGAGVDGVSGPIDPDLRPSREASRDAESGLSC